jgi:hypothetical protein
VSATAAHLSAKTYARLHTVHIFWHNCWTAPSVAASDIDWPDRFKRNTIRIRVLKAFEKLANNTLRFYSCNLIIVMWNPLFSVFPWNFQKFNESARIRLKVFFCHWNRKFFATQYLNDVAETIARCDLFDVTVQQHIQEKDGIFKLSYFRLSCRSETSAKLSDFYEFRTYVLSSHKNW